MPGSKHEDGTQSDSENALGEQRRAAALEERSWGLWGSAGIKESRANVPEGLFAEEDSPARRCRSSASKRQSGLVERRRGSAPHQQSGRDECYRHRDEYSDKGTYTIELENGVHEEEDARKLIDKVKDSGGGKSSQSGVLTKLPPRPLPSGQKRVEDARRRRKEEEKARESTGKPLLRQESFTVEKPSSSVPIELIPRIDAYTGTKTQREGGIDSVTLQRDSEAVATFLESTVSDQGDPPSQSIEGSMSPESDVDTTSTVSQADGVRKVVQKRRILAGHQKERTVVCTSNKGPAGSREHQDRRVKNRTSGSQQPSHPSTSLDLTDDDINSNSLLSDSQPISTQESRCSNPRAQIVGASTKSSRAKITHTSAPSAPSKVSNAPKPRPTRTSLLRRARLGDSSDTEPADMDRMSVASEASTASSTSRTGIARRGMSRIEALAQPRRPRVGSPSAQSDSEATVVKNRGLGPRSAAGDYVLRQGLRGSNVASVSGPRARANSASKLPDKAKGTSSYGNITPACKWKIFH
ncbi:hypothetical protein XENOCAPTIV_030987 [Xenoophorus captivus]|uniref:CEP170 C-terminal domain-containing protein n=1 Tax=Xenoophorus captivus TaxID=1517983 RepID=A0ABV0QM94_9TELE